MNQQDKDLLIKDLCARLPYGVKIQSEISVCNFGFKYVSKVCGMFDDLVIHESTTIRPQNTPAFTVSQCVVEECKTILFPLSAIKQEIEVNGKKICVNDFILDNTGFQVSETHLYCPMSIYRSLEIDEMDFILDTFHRYHIDYRNLIDNGLAISVYDLPENPYK